MRHRLGEVAKARVVKAFDAVRMTRARLPLATAAVSQRFADVEVAYGDREPDGPVALGRRADA